MPVADPARVTDALAAALAHRQPIWLVLHANHAREFTAGARAALRRVQARGIPLLGQSVLLRGVNDSAEALEALFRAMLAARVKPYYLHQLDPAPGTARFHVPIEEGRLLLAAYAGGSPGWPGRPMCWISRAGTAKCRSGRTIWRRRACAIHGEARIRANSMQHSHTIHPDAYALWLGQQFSTNTAGRPRGYGDAGNEGGVRRPAQPHRDAKRSRAVGFRAHQSGHRPGLRRWGDAR